MPGRLLLLVDVADSAALAAAVEVAAVVAVAADKVVAVWDKMPAWKHQALQKAIDDDAPAAQIKDALDKYEASQKTKQAALTGAQEALRGGSFRQAGGAGDVDGFAALIELQNRS